VVPDTVPTGDATNTPTDVQLRRDPYLSGAAGGLNVYDVYYGGFENMMPWLDRVPHANTLKSLSLSSGSLVPRFDAELGYYGARVPHHVRSLRTRMLRDDPRASVVVNGQKVGDDGMSAVIPLQVGRNSIAISVTAVDGAARYYTVRVERAGCEPRRPDGDERGHGACRG